MTSSIDTKQGFSELFSFSKSIWFKGKCVPLFVECTVQNGKTIDRHRVGGCETYWEKYCGEPKGNKMR
jgi:hypothetical protein